MMTTATAEPAEQPNAQPAGEVRRRPTLLCWAAAVTIIAFWGLIAVILLTQKQNLIERESRHHLLMSSMLAIRVERSLAESERLLNTIDPHSLEAAASEANGLLSRDLIASNNAIDAVITLDASGRTVSHTPGAPLLTEDAAQGLLQRAIADGTRIALGPMIQIEPGGQWLVPMLRPIRNAAGLFQGVTATLLNTDYLTQPFIGKAFGQWARVMVVGPDGEIWARRLLAGTTGSSTNINASGLHNLLMQPRDIQSFTAILSGPIDGVVRINAITRLPGREVWAVAGTELDEVLEPWRESMIIYLALGLLITALIAALAVWGIRNFEREHAVATAMNRAREEAETNSRLKSEFVTNMSHELRTPLASIVGFSELLLNRELSPEIQREFHQTILSAGKHLTFIVNDLLDISRIETGKLTVRPESVSLRPLLENCIQLQKAAADKKGLQLTLSVAPDAPSSLTADPTRLTQILTNLPGNAVKFTEQGFVKLEVRRTNEHLLFEVTDSGPGIDPIYLPNIFERFRQGDPSLTLKYGGTGLGLPLVKAITLLMGGTVAVDSQVGRGSRFAVSVPISLPAPR